MIKGKLVATRGWNDENYEIFFVIQPESEKKEEQVCVCV